MAEHMPSMQEPSTWKTGLGDALQGGKERSDEGESQEQDLSRPTLTTDPM